eukprot:TRINITY_DN3415_c1_g1_i1.p1 TRINITY_DN3415_c1_g1~~TRINITY_DN3415_c1_g1_i1.p1  ORF type:complete len:485 (-),score=245.25 TRINITY_DN3415_c1_g1_i1:39-1493(-)
MEKIEVGESLKQLNTAQEIVNFVKENKIEIIDACFTDPLGMWQHCSYASNQLDLSAFEQGLAFDGSSITLFRGIQNSDLIMKPDATTAWIDPFSRFKTLHINCDIYDPLTNQSYERDPRAIARKAQEYLKQTGIADQSFFGPEPEFFLFDDARFEVANNRAMFSLDAEEANWNSGKVYKTGNLAHRVEPKRAYFPLLPIDRNMDIRSEMLLTLEKIGIPADKHHHEVAVAQNELGFTALPLIQSADALMAYKYIVKNVARKHGKTVTFMPKPIFGDNGTGMHCHQSLWKEGKPLFYDATGYSGLSQLALHYIGGLLKHAPALLAFTNPTTNSYKRLVPGFEAPVTLVYSRGNRSAAIRIPLHNPTCAKAKRIEFRCPDALANPYIAFSAMLLAGLDGIQNRIDPGKPVDIDIYEMDEHERFALPQAPKSLSEALDNLERDHEFLIRGGVFTQEYIRAYIDHKRKEIQRVSLTPHPLEYVMYYHN